MSAAAAGACAPRPASLDLLRAGWRVGAATARPEQQQQPTCIISKSGTHVSTMCTPSHAAPAAAAAASSPTLSLPPPAGTTSAPS